jgi:hypothetical protein
MLKELKRDEFMAQFDESIHEAIDATAKRMEATHVVCFENVAFDSSRFGDRSALCVGPNNTYKSPDDCEGKWLNDLPSQRQYPQNYMSV